MKYSTLTDRLADLVESEHTCGCDQATCDVDAAYSNGYALWAIYLFKSSGAASEEFYDLIAKLPKRFMKDAEAERKAFAQDVEHTACPHCNAVIWEPQGVTSNDEVYCDSCAQTHSKSKGA